MPVRRHDIEDPPLISPWTPPSTPPRPDGKKRRRSLILPLLILVSCVVVYTFLSFILRADRNDLGNNFKPLIPTYKGSEDGECCQGIENLELGGAAALRWGSELNFNSSEECCAACKAMCNGNDGPCLCDTWVFCGNKMACGSQFGECLLKKQKDALAPEREDAGQTVMWTSGLIFGKREGIVGLQTEYGTLRIKLYPECAPRSVAYILELLTLRRCAGCQFDRAEGRGLSWDIQGNHIKDAPFGPPFGLIEGTLKDLETAFKPIPTEVCPSIRRGSVAWIGSGPEFFISLANHPEWKKNKYTVFGSVLPEDMEIAEKISQLPTKSDAWNNIDQTLLRKNVPFMLRRLKS